MRSSRDDPPGTAPPRCHLLDALPPISECMGAKGKPRVPALVHALIVNPPVSGLPVRPRPVLLAAENGAATLPVAPRGP